MKALSDEDAIDLTSTTRVWIAVPDNTDLRHITASEVNEYLAYGWHVEGPFTR